MMHGTTSLKFVLYLLSKHPVLSADSLSQGSQYKTGKDGQI